MINLYDFAPPLHMCIISQTGGGKTLLGSRMFDRLKHRAIFINYNDEPYFKKYPETAKINNLIKAMREHKKVVFYGTDIKNIDDIVQYIKEVKIRNKKFADTDFYFFFDEIQKYSSLQSIEDVFNLGRKWRIHGVGICRQIQEMKNLRIVSECLHLALLRMNDIGFTTLQKNYKIHVPHPVRSIINLGAYKEDLSYESKYYVALYDGVTYFIYDKDGKFCKKFTLNEGYYVENNDTAFHTAEEIQETKKGNTNTD